MPKYDRTRNRKRKKTKQINKRTRKQRARGKTERNYKRSRQLGGVFGWYQASDEGVKINGLERIVFSSVSVCDDCDDEPGGLKYIAMKNGENNLESLFLDKVPISPLEISPGVDHLKTLAVGDRKTLAVVPSLSKPQEVKLNLTDGTADPPGKPSVLLWPYLKSQITVRCQHPGEEIATINDCRKAHLRNVVQNISKEKTPDAPREVQSSVTVAFSRPLREVAETNTIQISEDKIPKLIDYLFKKYGVRPSPENIVVQMESGMSGVDLDKLMEELGILGKPTYRYGPDIPHCKRCPGMYHYYVISATESGDEFTFDQVARALDWMVKDSHNIYLDAVASKQSSSVQPGASDPGPAPGPAPAPAAPTQPNTPSFTRKNPKEIKNCELCNNHISESYDPRKMNHKLRKTCVHCYYVVCKDCFDQNTCNRCALRMLTE